MFDTHPQQIQYFSLSYLNKNWIGSNLFDFQVRVSFWALL